MLEQLAALKPPRVFDVEAPAADGRADHGVSAPPARRRLPQSEMNRRRFERQLLALFRSFTPSQRRLLLEQAELLTHYKIKLDD